MKTWDRETLGRFLDLTAGDRFRPAWLFLATTGCRRGECLGLRWSDLDLDAATATIRQTIVVLDHQPVTKSGTKWGKGRSIRLDATTVATLRAHRAQQAAERLAVGAGYQEQDSSSPTPRAAPGTPSFSRSGSPGWSSGWACHASASTTSATPGPRWPWRPAST